MTMKEPNETGSVNHHVRLAIQQSRIQVPALATCWDLLWLIPSSNPQPRLLIANRLPPASWGF